MTKYKFICRAISFVIAVILALILSCFLKIDDVYCIDAIKINSSSQESYVLLKEYAISYVNTLDKKSIPENINVTHAFEKENILITVDNGMFKVEARYPVELKLQGKGSFLLNISYEEGTFKEYSNNENTHVYIACMLLFFCFISGGIYWIIYIILFKTGEFVIKKKFSKA